MTDLLDVVERELSRLHAEIERLEDKNRKLTEENRKLRIRRTDAGQIYDSGIDLVF